MRLYDADQPVIFTHIPKCAGVSFVRLLNQWFRGTYHKLNQNEREDLLLPRIATRNAAGAWLPHVRCIHGHFNHRRGYGLPYYYPEIRQYFTVFRDPFDIVVSMYFFFKRRSREGRFFYRGKALDVRERYASVGDYVSDHPDWLFDHLPQEINLANYREKLQTRFVYIGVCEDMPRTVESLATVLGKPCLPLPRLNVSEYDEPVPESLRQPFYEAYPLLRKIYDFALENYRL